MGMIQLVKMVCGTIALRPPACSTVVSKLKGNMNGTSDLGHLNLNVTSDLTLMWDVDFRTAGTYAQSWFSDAQAQANQHGIDARRLEIVFALATAESYLFEWVRDDVLKKDYIELDKYFPPGAFRRVKDRWKDVPKQLKDDGLITQSQNLGGRTWKDFGELVQFRNGLLHGSASRPGNDKRPDENQPRPSIKDLNNLSSGWAVCVVQNLIEELHAAAGTTPPDWLL